jgi:hypothetical protein
MKAAEKQASLQGRVMKQLVRKFLMAAVLSALIAGAMTILPGASNPVVASAPIHGGGSDRSEPRPVGTQCSQQAWPYYQADCIRDRHTAEGEVKAVRVVTTDRIDASTLNRIVK